jgi:hypothetical protein
MTPQEIADYKQSWMPGYAVRLHSDLSDAGKTWCRRQLDRKEWSFKPWTYNYEHTFHFENITVAQNFAMEFGKYANQERI